MSAVEERLDWMPEISEKDFPWLGVADGGIVIFSKE